jgi:hypothetical protein
MIHRYLNRRQTRTATGGFDSGNGKNKTVSNKKPGLFLVPPSRRFRVLTTAASFFTRSGSRGHAIRTRWYWKNNVEFSIQERNLGDDQRPEPGVAAARQKIPRRVFGKSARRF